MQPIASKRFVFILGMHRSGTSCLAGCLERCGLYLGAVRRTGRFNAKGYYELQAVERLHDQILALNQASWHHPPHQLQLHPYHRHMLQQVADQLSRHRPCGLKDPRLLLLLDAWLEITSPPHAFVGTFRHPVAVAHSLARRNGFREDAAFQLWTQYNTLLMRRHQVTPFPLVEFDLFDMDRYCRTVTGLAFALGLSPNFFQLRHFVSTELDHHHSGDASIPPSCQEVYAYLQQHCYQPPLSETPLPLSTGRRARLHGAVREATFFATHILPAWLVRQGQHLIHKLPKRLFLR